MRIAAVEAVFLTAKDAACVRGTTGFFVATVDVPLIAFRAPVPARVDLITVVLDEVTEDNVPVLFLRSPCRVAGRGRGDRTDLGPVAARAVVNLDCDECRLSAIVDAVAPRGRAPSPAARRGLEGLSGDIGRDK